MEPQVLLSLLRRRWLPLLLCLLAGLGAAEAVTRRSTPFYASSARLFVNIPSATSRSEAESGLRLTSQLLRSYAQVATSRSAAQQIVERLTLPEGPDSLRSRISATPEADTLLVTVSAVDADPQRARSIANMAANVLIDTINEFEKGKGADAIQAEVIDDATAAGSPYTPRPRLNLLAGGFLGLVLGLAAGLLLDVMDRSVKAPGQAAELFRAPMLGLVPRRKEVTANPVVTVELPTDPASESYRALRTAVRFINPDEPLRTILVTSPTPNDGKTTTAVNLAVAMAQSGERVVLVDADLRRAQLGGLLGIESAVGVTSVVTHLVAPTDALQNWRDILGFMPSGPLPPNPSEILGSQTMAQLINALRNLADVVIFDAPPVLPVTDAVVLSTQVDGVILVARSGRTQRNAAAEAHRRLDTVGANVVGFVLNAVPTSASVGYYEDYRYVDPRAGSGVERLQGRLSGRIGRRQG